MSCVAKSACIIFLSVRAPVDAMHCDVPRLPLNGTSHGNMHRDFAENVQFITSHNLFSEKRQ